MAVATKRSQSQRRREEIFEALVTDVGERIPGCLVCVIVDKYCAHACSSQVVCQALNKTIIMEVSDVFQAIPRKELREQLKRPTGDYVTDIMPRKKRTQNIIEELFRLPALEQVHFCLFYYTTEKLVYRTRNRNFPLSMEALQVMSEGIFKSWLEMQTANMEYGDVLLLDDRV